MAKKKLTDWPTPSKTQKAKWVTNQPGPRGPLQTLNHRQGVDLHTDQACRPRGPPAGRGRQDQSPEWVARQDHEDGRDAP
eukprot:1375677-Pyramimonas_sp.AAC.1